MDGVSVAELKKFVKAVGGAHGPDTWAQLVHPDVQDDFEEVEESDYLSTDGEGGGAGGLS